jgi:hypothetical protein
MQKNYRLYIRESVFDAVRQTLAKGENEKNLFSLDEQTKILNLTKSANYSNMPKWIVTLQRYLNIQLTDHDYVRIEL